MKKYMILTAIFCLLIAFPGCGSDDKDTPNGGVVEPPVEVPQTMKGSFESKYKRYAQRDKHEGQSSSDKIVTQWRDTVWRNERVHTQIILWAEKNVKGITYQVNDLKCGGQTLSSSNIRLRFPTYVLGIRKLWTVARRLRVSRHILRMRCRSSKLPKFRQLTRQRCG
ncbi:hypothetical protein SFC43_17850 [Bacteroides sp. CR5/BHMF/2]|nr:hypothetical protein [Bacteroides sp. CR5/BHMF/2]